MTEKKSWVEIFLMPFVIASVGILGTYLITQQQADIAERKAISDQKVVTDTALLEQELAKAKADSDRQVKILEIFAEKITSKDETQRLLAIKLLRVLDDDLAGKLALAVAEAEPEESKIKKVATKVANVAKARIEHQPRIYIHVYSNAEKKAAQIAEEILEKNNWVVPGIQSVGAKSPNSSQLRYFKKSEESVAKEIYDSLKNANYNISLSYTAGYEKSKTIRPMHFELWFASGKP